MTPLLAATLLSSTASVLSVVPIMAAEIMRARNQRVIDVCCVAWLTVTPIAAGCWVLLLP